MRELVSDATNWYGSDNWDADRFGPYRTSIKGEVARKINQKFSKRMAIVPLSINDSMTGNIDRLQNLLEGLNCVYDLLGDEHSKSILVKVWAFRLLGPDKVKLPLNTNEYWAQRESMSRLTKGRDTIKLRFHQWQLKHLALAEIGYPIELFFIPAGIPVTFLLKQYEYGQGQQTIKAEEGDYVIDGGSCWGDTALYFAQEVGEKGRVYSFEFTPDNLDVFRRNVSLNPQLLDRIEIVPKALWGTSGEILNYSANGPATSVARADNGDRDLEVSTITIDDFVKEKKLARVDFIKMDIEGAELSALKGAEETLREFKPKLAISIYHKDTDFIDIPTYLDTLRLGYEFFLDHFTIYGEETVLFATPSK